MDNQASRFIEKKGMLEACFFGFNQPYQKMLSQMHSLHERVKKNEICDQLMLLEHEPVITITRQHMFKSLKTSENAIKKSGIELAVADRGGDATFHGPGQLVGYPLISLEKNSHYLDVSKFIRSLEYALFLSIQYLGIDSVQLLPGFSGVWVKHVDEYKHVRLKKVVAIGVGIKDGVSKHGFAMNIDIDHHCYIEHIVPCGLKDRGVITLKELFYLKSLPLPSYSAIVKTVSECLSRAFSLTLKWRS